MRPSTSWTPRARYSNVTRSSATWTVMTTIRALLAALLAVAAAQAGAVSCGDRTHQGRSYTVCEVAPAQEDLRLFYKDEDGKLLGQFFAVDDALEADGAE